MNSDKSRAKSLLNKINFLLANNFNYLIAIVILLILLFSFFVILKPEYDDIREKAKELTAKTEEEYFEKIKRFKRLSDYIEVYNEIDTKDIQKVEVMLSRQELKEELFTRIESIIENNGLMLLSIIVQEEQEEQTVVNKRSVILNEVEEDERKLPSEIGKIKLELSIMGADYKGLKNLLRVFENNLRIMDVEHISFSPKGETIDLKITSYYYK